MPVLQRLRRASAGRWRRVIESLESRTLLTGLTGQYFDRPDFTDLKLTRTDATVDFNWPAAPAASMSADFYSARWRGQVEAPSTEPFTFYVNSDDGVRLWVDGRLLVDNWVNQGATEKSATVALEAGQRYDIRLDYYEYDLGAQVRLSWSSLTQPKQVIPAARLFPSPSGLTGTFYDNIDFTAQTLTRNDAAVNFDWGSGSPDPAIVPDTFSARWTGQVVPQFSETYTFYASGDWIGRLRVDGELVVDNTSVQDGAEIRLEAGKRYDIQFDYAEDTGTAAPARLEWSSPSQPRQVIPTSRLFASVATTVPSRRADYSNAVLNADRPDPGVIFADGAYWMVHTTGGPNNGWPLYRSEDMTSWTFVRHLLTTANKPSFMTDAFWAPEIHKIGNQFVLTGTSWSDQYQHLVIALATAPEVGGPYTVQQTPIVSDTRHVLDSHIFQDHDGKVYMLWKRDGPSNGTFGSIRIREMNATGTAFAAGSSAVTILDNSVGGWERNLAEAPWMIRRGGFYYLFYSGGFIDTTYSLGVARSTSPLTPFARSAANPIITHNATWAGPGHGGFALDRDGVAWHLYHTRHANNPDFGRVQVLDRVIWGVDGWPTFGNGGTVSTGVQPGPVVDAASGAGLITVVGDVTTVNQNDTFRVARSTSDASRIDLFVNGVLSRSVPFGETQQLTIDGRGGNDTLQLDFSRGEAIPGAGIQFLGAAGTDTVRLTGAGPNDAFRYANGQFSHGTGILSFSGAETFLLENANFRLDGNAAGATVEVAAGGRAMFNVSQQLAALRVTNGGRATLASGGAKTLAVNTLSVTGAGSTLDLADNAMLIRNVNSFVATATHTSVNNLVRNAFNDFAWNGAGITSSTAQTDVADGLPSTLGILLNNDGAGNPLFYGTGTANPTFMGATVDANTVMVRFTRLGDGDLNGVVDTVDFALFQAGYTGTAPYVGFAFGDYDYNGVIDTVDFGLFQAGYQPAGAPAAASVDEGDERLALVGTALGA